MTDNLTIQQRKKCMSHIHSKWTFQEVKIHNYLKGKKIKHKMHPSIIGNPDILLTSSNTAVFLHGCFWHKCPKCYKAPKSHRHYWMPKIENNIRRFKMNSRKLNKVGYKILVLWEHDIKQSFERVIKRIISNNCKTNKSAFRQYGN